MADSRPVRGFLASLASLAVAGVTLLPAQSTPQIKAPESKGPDFAKEIQPLLREKCLPCHGDVQKAGGLRLTQLKAAMTGGTSGARGLVPHDPDASSVIQRVVSTDENLRMPPKWSDKKPFFGFIKTQ